MLCRFLSGLHRRLPLGLLAVVALASSSSCQMFTGSKADETEETAPVDKRLVTEPQTPFFSSLGGSNPKPASFLEAGTEVVMLVEDDKETFSKVRLPGGGVGWTPTRLVVTKIEPEPEEEETEETQGDPTEVLPLDETVPEDTTVEDPESAGDEVTDPDEATDPTDPSRQPDVDITIPEVNPLPIEDM